MILETAEVGKVQCNCYVVGCDKTKEGVIIDAGGDADIIEELVKRNGLVIKYYLCTHGHFDHVEGLSDLLKKYKAPILLHEADLPLYSDLPGQGSIFGMLLEPTPLCNHFVKDGDKLAFGELEITVLHTPGHSPGSVSYRSGTLVFTGDTVFAGSIGRTDLPGGSYEQLITSAREKIMCLDEGTRLYPGHGPATTVGVEKKHNPYLGKGAASFFV
jgi:hydroxyacylglutathione hydrolase